MTTQELIIIALAATILGAVLAYGLVFYFKRRRRKKISRALDMVLFLVTVPREKTKSDDEEDEKRPAELMENMYSTLASLSKGHERGTVRPYVTLEMAVHNSGDDIHFYVSVPSSFASSFEKRVHGSFPAAEVERTKDYNIFSSGGYAMGSVMSLKKNSVLPLGTYKNLEINTLDQITTALSKIEAQGEGAAIQLVLRPSSGDVNDSGQKVASMMRSGKSLGSALSQVRKNKSILLKTIEALSSDNEDSDKSEHEERKDINTNTIELIESKSQKTIFETNIRILVSADIRARAKELLSNIEGAFSQFSIPNGNSPSFRTLRGRRFRRLSYNFSFRIFDESKSVYLSTEELASIFHFPAGGVAAPRVKYLKVRPFEPPTELSDEGVILGLNNFRGVETTVRMADDDRRRHLYMIGQTGTGKSSLMKNMVSQDLRDGKGVCVIDPHGDFADYALSATPEERRGDVIYFNPGITDPVLGLNMLSYDQSKPEQKTFIVNELLKIFDKLYDLQKTGGPLFEQYFRNAVLLVMDDAAVEPPTFASVSKVLADASYRKDKLSRENNPLVKEFWQEQAEKAGGEAALSNMVPYITSKFDQFLANDFMRPILNQSTSAFDFREVMDEGKILIVNLSKGRIGELNANLLGMIIVGRLLMAALSRVDTEDETARRDFYLYIDEFQNFTTDSIATILSEARKYRLNLTIAHQFIKQIPENIQDAVFGNVGSTISFRVGAEDAEVLEKQFAPTISARDILNLDNFNAYVRLLINNQTSKPFNIKTLRPDNPDPMYADAVKRESLERYGKSREVVEKEIREKYKKVKEDEGESGGLSF